MSLHQHSRVIQARGIGHGVVSEKYGCTVLGFQPFSQWKDDYFVKPLSWIELRRQTLQLACEEQVALGGQACTRTVAMVMHEETEPACDKLTPHVHLTRTPPCFMWELWKEPAWSLASFWFYQIVIQTKGVFFKGRCII